MDIALLGKALILGIVEGLTEVLPVSSTGHLIIVGDMLNFNDDMGKVFDIVIQLGAILAVCWAYRDRVNAVVRGIGKDRQANRFVLILMLGFIPTGILGLLFNKIIKTYLFNPLTVASALIVGALVILWVESRPARPKVYSVDDMRGRQAFNIGLAQSLGMFPGVSRSGATIIGGMLLGLDRKAAAEYSFFLAIPTMFAATLYSVYKSRELFSWDFLPMFAVGFIAAFFAGIFAVKTMVRFVSNHTFKVFAWYRIAFGLLVLASWKFGWVDWSLPG